MVRRFLIVAGLLLASLAIAGPAAADHHNCSDYPTQEAAQAALKANPDDPNGLDGPVGRGTDGQAGVACESRPCPCNTVNVYAQETTNPTAAPAVNTTVVAAASTATTAAVAARTTTADTGPLDYLWLVAAGGLVAVFAGTRMRGRRAAGVHYTA